MYSFDDGELTSNLWRVGSVTFEDAVAVVDRLREELCQLTSTKEEATDETTDSQNNENGTENSATTTSIEVSTSADAVGSQEQEANSEAQQEDGSTPTAVAHGLAG